MAHTAQEPELKMC